MTAPVESVTVPEIAPVPAICAFAPSGVSRAATVKMVSQPNVALPRSLCFGSMAGALVLALISCCKTPHHHCLQKLNVSFEFRSLL